MSRTLALLHTAALHEARFAALHAAHCAPLSLRQYSHPELLDIARESGVDAPALRAALADCIATITADGATALLCTCSTIGAAAEAAGADADLPSLRVDRPMAAAAVAAVPSGGRIALLASLESTLEPSAALLREEAARGGRSLHVDSYLLPGVFAAAMAGDAAGARRRVGAAIDGLSSARPRPDALVLAQVSLADAADWPCALPLLSSPLSGLRAAAALCGSLPS